MTKAVNILEDFSQTITISQEANLSLNEDQRLQAFEDGYSAGWSDAAKAYTEDRSHATMAIAATISDMAFTFQEAQSAMISALAPFIHKIVDTVLPEIARKSIGLRVCELLLSSVTDQPPYEVIVSGHANTLEAVRRALPEVMPLTIRLLADPTLVDGQVVLRIGSREQEVNLNDLLSRINTSISEFFATNIKELRYG